MTDLAIYMEIKVTDLAIYMEIKVTDLAIYKWGSRPRLY